MLLDKFGREPLTNPLSRKKLPNMERGMLVLRDTVLGLAEEDMFSYAESLLSASVTAEALGHSSSHRVIEELSGLALRHAIEPPSIMDRTNGLPSYFEARDEVKLTDSGDLDLDRSEDYLTTKLQEDVADIAPGFEVLRNITDVIRLSYPVQNALDATKG